MNVSKKVKIFEDESKSANEVDILNGLYEDSFIPNKTNLLYLKNNNKSIYYIKLDLKNISNKNKLEIYIWINYFNYKEISCIYLNDKDIIRNNFLSKIDQNDKDISLNYSYVSLEILPNETKTIYIKTKFFKSPIILTKKENIIKEERIFSFFTSLFLGVSSVILLVILIFYLELRKKYLLYFASVIIFTYLKSCLFHNAVRYYMNISNRAAFDIYMLSAMIFTYSLIHFIIDVLGLDRCIDKIKIKYYLIFIKYIYTTIIIACLLRIVSPLYCAKSIRYMYIILFTLVLHTAIKKYREGWLYKVFLIGWINQWLIYTFASTIHVTKICGYLNNELLSLILSDIRIVEFIELFANLVLITGILIYNLKEVWRYRNTVEDQEEIVKIINGADNLMHGLIILIHSYKKNINFNKVMFFRRKVDRDNDDILYYDFSVPLTLEERQKEKKYFDLAKHLSRDTFDDYSICRHIQSDELYKIFLPEYCS